MQPHSLAALAVGSDQFDPQRGADQTLLDEVVEKAFRGGADAEGDLIDPIERGLEVDDGVHIAGRDARGRRTRVATGGESVQPRAHRAETGGDVGFGEFGETTESADAEPGEQRHQLGVFEQFDGQRGEKLGRRLGGHDRDGIGVPENPALHPAGGAFRGEQPVGDPGPHRRHSEFFDRADQGESGSTFSAVVLRRTAGAHRQHPGSQRMHAGQRALHRREDRLERPGVEGGVVAEEVDRGTSGLRLALPHAASHTLRPSGRGAGEYDVLVDQGYRGIRRQPLGDGVGVHGPIGAPQYEKSGLPR